MTPCTLRLLTLLQISIHTSAREVTQHKTKVQNIFSHFNPHFRKGSDGQDIDWTATEDDISIHTSAREVTAKVRVRIMPKPISIHTSAREVTEWASFSDLIKNISIHTSAREVTCCVDSKGCRSQHFNPHFRKGSDLRQLPILPCNHHFNPHFRKGSDRSSLPERRWERYFNPHFRKGSDCDTLAIASPISSFQSTLPQGK